MAKLTKEKIIEALKKLGAKIAENAKKPELEKLLKKEMAKGEKDVPARLKSEEKEVGEEKEGEEGQAESPKDYLLQYQYGKEMPLGDPNSNPSPGSKSARMKKQLLAQPRVSIFIPREQDESPKVTLSVTLNGYRLDLPKQTYLKLPEQIAEVIMESQKQQVEALRPFRIDRDKKTEDALS